MRAAATSVWARARSWQSQRVTRRSFLVPAESGPAGTVFHPVPSHNGQTSAGTLITLHYSWFNCITAGYSSGELLSPPSGLAHSFVFQPTACAVGCILSLLRSCGRATAGLRADFHPQL